MRDEVIEELWQIKDKLARSVNYDVRALAAVNCGNGRGSRAPCWLIAPAGGRSATRLARPMLAAFRR